MLFKTIANATILFCVVFFITFGLEHLLFGITDYSVYRVLDNSFQNFLVLFLVFLLQYVVIKRIPFRQVQLWNSLQVYRHRILVLLALSVFGCGLYHFLPSSLPAWTFLLGLGAISTYTVLVKKISSRSSYQIITLILFCAGFNASLIFWIHEEGNTGKRIKYAQQLAERRDTIAENQIIYLMDDFQRSTTKEVPQYYWERKWLSNSYLSSNYQLDMRRTPHFSGPYLEPILDFSESFIPTYQVHLLSGYRLSFKLKKEFKRSIYTTNHPYKNMDRLKDYHFIVVDQGKVVLANSHNFDLDILNIPMPDIGEKAKVQLNGYDLDAYHHSEEVFVLIGEPLSEVLVWISNFSLFFSLFLLISVLLNSAKILFISGTILERWQKLPIHFRIQTTLITLTISLFFIIAITTFYFLQQNNSVLTRERQIYIAETIQKVISEDFHEFSWNTKRYKDRTLTALADRKQCEIDIYNPRGKLMVSSISTAQNSPAPKQIDKKLRARLQNNSFAIIVKQHKKDDESYLRSVFSIFKNNQLKGFVAISSYESEIGSAQDIPIIMSNLLNVYVFLLLFTWTIGLSLISLLNSPLQLLAQRLSLFKPGNTNEKLAWKSDDAIGTLINEYNNMVDVVDKTTNELIRSERQGAWQIMSQQIAHEINNTLTPFRLNIQYFSHVVARQDAPSPEVIQRITSSLIEQVDQLSKIASQFKIFAHLEAPETEPIDLVCFLDDFMTPFKTREDVQFDFINLLKNEENPTITIDEDHLRQILNNLISNSENAIPENRKGIIIIVLKKEKNSLSLQIKDNGIGIDPTIQKNLFDPKFSTSSSQTGLGLPICKRIIDFYDGVLNFTTELNTGTCFQIDFAPSNSETDPPGPSDHPHISTSSLSNEGNASRG